MLVSTLLYFVQKTSVYELNSILCDFADRYLFLSIIFDNNLYKFIFHYRNFLRLQIKHAVLIDSSYQRNRKSYRSKVAIKITSFLFYYYPSMDFAVIAWSSILAYFSLITGVHSSSIHYCYELYNCKLINLSK